jgi:hypothetical protein
LKKGFFTLRMFDLYKLIQFDKLGKRDWDFVSPLSVLPQGRKSKSHFGRNYCFELKSISLPII